MVLQTMKRNQQLKILEEAFKEADMISDGIATQLQLILPAKLMSLKYSLHNYYQSAPMWRRSQKSKFV